MSELVLEQLTKDERSLLLYLESCMVDYGGKIDTRHINSNDIKILELWCEEKRLDYGRIKAEFITDKRHFWVELTDPMFNLAQQERRARATRMKEKNKHQRTSERNIVSITPD